MPILVYWSPPRSASPFKLLVLISDRLLGASVVNSMLQEDEGEVVHPLNNVDPISSSSDSCLCKVNEVSPSLQLVSRFRRRSRYLRNKTAGNNDVDRFLFKDDG